jgi:hypothetical protein
MKRELPTILFVRTPIDSAKNISVILQNLVLAGWEVVSHAEARDEYTFVLKARVL